jgi:hypothetical protein
MPDNEKRRSWVRAGPVRGSLFISDVCVRWLAIFIIVPLAFIALRSHQIPSGPAMLADFVFPRFFIFWPALQEQQTIVREALGDGQARWFALYFVVLFAGLTIALARLLYEMSFRTADILPLWAGDTLAVVEL